MSGLRWFPPRSSGRLSRDPRDHLEDLASRQTPLPRSSCVSLRRGAIFLNRFNRWHQAGVTEFRPPASRAHARPKARQAGRPFATTSSAHLQKQSSNPVVRDQRRRDASRCDIPTRSRRAWASRAHTHPLFRCRRNAVGCRISAQDLFHHTLHLLHRRLPPRSPKTWCCPLEILAGDKAFI